MESWWLGALVDWWRRARGVYGAASGSISKPGPEFSGIEFGA